MAREPGRPPQAGSALDRLIAFGLALASLIVVVTCTVARGHSREPGPHAPEATADRPPLSAEVVELPAGVEGQAARAPERPAPEAVPPLASFFGALERLARGERREHVRIFWLGDSHTAADLWTHAVREALEERFGVGGPGFVHLGLKTMRHSQVKTDVFGQWQRLPTQPARWTPFDDGSFGLGGMRAVAKQGAVCKAKLRDGAVRGAAHWSLYYRNPLAASFQLTLGERSLVVGSSAAQGAEIQRLELAAPAEAELVLRQQSGMPEFFGAVVEGELPGVVLDTLGIDGAKVRTPLAWQADAFVSALRQRAPDLVILAYGTNEVFEGYPVSDYAQQYRDLIQRLRSAVPNAACLLIGPTDVMQSDGFSHPRVLEVSRAEEGVAAELGCGYVGAHLLMGGEGSYAEWLSARPQLAGVDGVHLTVRGYQELGRLTADYLLTSYDRSVPPHAVAR